MDPALQHLLQKASLAHRAGDLGEAERLYRSVLSAEPRDAAALTYLGILCGQTGNLAEAERLLTGSLGLEPRQALALNALGNVFKAKGRFEEALARYDGALAIDPQNIPALENRGTLLEALDRASEAVAVFDRAIALAPDYANLYAGRGQALERLGRFDEALANYGAAIARNPRYAAAYQLRLNLLKELKRFDEALADYDTVLALDRARPYVLGDHFALRMTMCRWERWDDSRGEIIDGIASGARVAAPFAAIKIGVPPALQKRCAEIYVRDVCPPAPEPLWRGETYAHRRIRIAYVSANFTIHAMAQLMAGIFESHDRTQFETIAISLARGAPTAMRARLERAFDTFLDAERMDDRAVAEWMRDREIDIAVDLMGHTRGARTGIFALRPAPVQVNYLGFPGTMGAPYIDYLIADRYVAPPEDHIHYTEKIVTLPGSYLPNDRKRAIAPRTPARSEAGLPEKGFVFCSFNDSVKFTPSMFAVWMRLLKRVEGSVLWVPRNNESAAGNLVRAAESHGIEVARLVFAEHVPEMAEHLARLRLADLFLDTLPYNAHSTACDALWAGVPVLTCMGESFAGRVAASALAAAGVPELVTRSLGEYEAMALALARGPERLSSLRARLANGRMDAALFDTGRQARALERAYAEMIARLRKHETPSAIDLSL